MYNYEGWSCRSRSPPVEAQSRDIVGGLGGNIWTWAMLWLRILWNNKCTYHVNYSGRSVSLLAAKGILNDTELPGIFI